MWRFSSGVIQISHLLNLLLQFIRGGLDRHAGAVEGEGKEDVLPFVPLVLGTEDGLGEGEGVAEVEATVHVRVGEGDHEGFAGAVWVGMVVVVVISVLFCLMT